MTHGNLREGERSLRACGIVEVAVAALALSGFRAYDARRHDPAVPEPLRT